MKATSNPKGVLEKKFADDRITKKELGFRFRVRGEAVCWAVRTFLNAARRRNLSLLDMGAADGRTLLYINDNVRLGLGLGIEYNPELIQKSEACPSHITLKTGDVTDLSNISDASFDVVSALAVLEHLPNPIKAMREASRTLRSGGLFVATSPIPFWDHLSVRLGLLAEDHHECDMHPSFFRGLFSQIPELSLCCFKRFMWAPIGILPYLGINMNPNKSFKLDMNIEKLKIANSLFVNQVAVAIKL